MKSTSRILKALSSIIILLLTGLSAMAQEKAHLKGHIVDPMGAAIAKTQILVESPTQKFQTITGEDGEYNLELPAGVYRVSTLKMPGFIPFKANRVRIEARQTKILNMKLKVTLKDAICILNLTGSPVKETKNPRRKPRLN